MAFQEGITGFIRVPGSSDPNRVFALGPGGGPVQSEEELVKMTGAPTKEEAFAMVNIKTPEEARALGVRLAGTPKLFEEQADVLTTEMLGTTQLQLPKEPSLDISKITDITSGLTGLVEFYKQQSEMFAKQREETQKEQKGLLEKAKGIFEGRATMEARLKEERERLGIEKTFTQIQGLVSEADAIRQNLIGLQERKELQLLDIENKPITMEHILGEQAVVERQWNSRIAAESARLGAKAAMIEALQGNISTANTLVNQTVNAMVYDQERDYKMLQDFIDTNKDIISKLDTQYQNAIQNTLNTAQDVYTEKKSEAEKIQALAIDAASKYGVALDLTGKTLTEATEAYNEAITPLAKEERELKLESERALIEQRLREGKGEIAFEKEWQAAGGLAGTGMSLADWIMKRTGVKELPKLGEADIISGVSQINPETSKRAEEEKKILTLGFSPTATNIKNALDMIYGGVAKRGFRKIKSFFGF